LIAATSQRGLAPRPAQVSPDGPRYFGGSHLKGRKVPAMTPLSVKAKLLNYKGESSMLFLMLRPHRPSEIKRRTTSMAAKDLAASRVPRLWPQDRYPIVAVAICAGIMGRFAIFILF